MGRDPGPLRPARDPLGRGLEAELVAELAPLGARLRIETNSPEVLDHCRASFGPYGDPPADASRQLVLRLLVDPRLEGSPPWEGPIFRGQSELFYISAGGSNTAVADLARGSAIGFFAPAMVRDGSFFRRNFLECLVLTLLTHGQASVHSYVHASAVARAGRGVLFSGPSRSGKSTLALACCRRGFALVSDDVVYLEERGREVVAWGKPWRLRLLPESIALFPDLEGKGEPAGDCIELDSRELFAGRVQPRCRPAALFFLQRTSGAPGCEPIDEDAALDLLARDLIQDDAEVLDRHRRLWLEVIRRGAFVLSGDDLAAQVDLVERFLASSR